MLSVESARSWYPHNDPVHGFDHVLRVYRTAEYLAQAEGADLEIVRAAALLHDVDSELGSNFSHQGPAASNQASMRVEGGRDAHHHGAAEFACQILQATIRQAGTFFRARCPSGDLGRSLCNGDAVFVRGRHEGTERLGQK